MLLYMQNRGHTTLTFICGKEKTHFIQNLLFDAAAAQPRPPPIIYCYKTRTALYEAAAQPRHRLRSTDVGIEEYYKIEQELLEIPAAEIRGRVFVFDDVYYDGRFLKNRGVFHRIHKMTDVIIGTSYPFKELQTSATKYVVMNDSEFIKKCAWNNWFSELIAWDDYVRLFWGLTAQDAIIFDCHDKSWTAGCGPPAAAPETKKE